MKKVHYIFLSLALLLGCSRVVFQESHTKVDSISAQLDSLLAVPELANAITGIAVRSLTSGTMVYEKNAFTSLVPASNLKLLTTATALRLLGPNAHFTTKLYLTGSKQDSIFNGDVLLQGGGDPTLVWVDSLGGVPLFQHFAIKLSEMGITEIKGRLIGDDNYFDDQEYGIGWSWENNPYYFQPPICALSINNNCVDFTLCGGDTMGESISLSFTPPFSDICIINRAVTSLYTDISIERQPGSNTYIVSGTMAPGTRFVRTRTIKNPTSRAVDLFKQTLNDFGIRVGPALDIDDIEYFNIDTTLVMESASPPLSDIVTTINKKSDNLAAELLLKLIGKKVTDYGSSENGANVVLDYWRSRGIATHDLFIVDGSGLSRKNLLTPACLVSVLTEMYSDSVFYNSLPIAGLDGTLERSEWTRNQNIRAKTGTLDHVKALSGYIKTKHGDELAFSFLVNHHLVETEKIIYIQDRFCQLLTLL